MSYSPRDRFHRRRPTRRDFLWLLGATSSVVLLPPWLSGCATDPVTGRTTLVGISEADEIALDKQKAPLQFSKDYGPVQDPALRRYVSDVSQRMWPHTHRPRMPYSATVVNATYVNAYTFPGGSMAATRGILLDMESEDELMALIGHETGHVNARHSAKRQGRALVAGAAVGLAGIATAASDYSSAAPLVSVVGQLGSSALLAGYSREDEREADALGLEYLTRSGYNPDGMVNLLEGLQASERTKPSLIETMFRSHPMSAERVANVRRDASTRYGAARKQPLQRERYLDETAGLRRLRPAIEAMQQAETSMAKGRNPEAEGHLRRALGSAPDDYAALCMMSKVKLAQKQYGEADRYLSRARAAYPGEGHALQLDGINKLALRRPEEALAQFQAYERRYPGNASTQFFQGVAYENMQNRPAAADAYRRYVQAGARDSQAQYAVQRLREWGAVK